MKIINLNAFVTPLMTLAAIAIPATSNAQFAPSNCSTYQNMDYQADVHFNTESLCIQDAVETIYNPNPTWQPNL